MGPSLFTNWKTFHEKMDFLKTKNPETPQSIGGICQRTGRLSPTTQKRESRIRCEQRKSAYAWKIRYGRTFVIVKLFSFI
jgi:hypothetical protein